MDTQNTLKAIKYSSHTLQLLDQLRLPHESVYIDIHNAEDAFRAIKTMQVRGAPAIAIVAALSVAVEVHSTYLKDTSKTYTGEEVAGFVKEKMQYLLQSRPTAVNLADACEKLVALVHQVAEDGKNGAEVAQAYADAAEKMLEDDVKDNMNIGREGAKWIMDAAGKQSGIKVLTHCNTGSLATAGYGTALGIVRSLHSSSALSHAYCTETRPYNQGSRLTAYELVHEQIPATLITDSMASVVMQLHGVDAVVVGADRVARNGDTANKIGTYQLAIAARHHGVKFVVAAPTTSIDVKTPDGSHITIEERPGAEMVTINGPCVIKQTDIINNNIFNNNSNSDEDLDLDDFKTVRVAAKGIGIFNPAFDVTPASLIDAIATEKGILLKNENGHFDTEKLFLTS